MQFIYGKAPIKFTDGTPSHLAGEWPGIKSCRFHSYRKVINPIDHGIIYNQNEPTLKPNKKLLGPQEPSPEFVYKPCAKRVILEKEILKPKGKKCLPFPSKPIIPLKEKKHRFLYKIEQDKISREEMKTQPNDFFVKKELKYLARSRGFFPKKYYYVNDAKLLMTMGNNGNGINNLNFDDEIHYDEEYEMLTKKQKLELKLKKIRENRINLNKEIELVKSLTDWDKKFFPKPEKKVVLPEIKTDETHEPEDQEDNKSDSKKSVKTNNKNNKK